MIKYNKKGNHIPDCLWMKMVKICHLVTTNSVRNYGLYERLSKIINQKRDINILICVHIALKSYLFKIIASF